MSFKNLRWMFLFGAISLVACQEVRTDQRVVLLANADGDGYMASSGCDDPTILPAGEGGGDVIGGCDTGAEPPPPDNGCVIFPDPGGCAFLEYTETITTIIDEYGNIIEQTISVCTQCLDENGAAVGEPECSDGGVIEPVVCNPIDSGDPTIACWECSSPDGEYLYQECQPIPTYCNVDSDCPDGQSCLLYPIVDCGPNELCALPVEQGICVAPVLSCEALTDEESCYMNGCDWIYTEPNCLEGGSFWEGCPGYCVTPQVPTCYSDDDCNPGEICLLSDFECPPGALCPEVMTGYCVPAGDNCGVVTDEESCHSLGCDWLPADPACLGGPSGEGCPGSCVMPQDSTCYSDDDCNPGEVCELLPWECPEGMACPAVESGYCVPAPDECSQITDEASCSANPACQWFYFGMPCVEGEECVSGVCQLNTDCGDGTILPAP